MITLKQPHRALDLAIGSRGDTLGASKWPLSYHNWQHPGDQPVAIAQGVEEVETRCFPGLGCRVRAR